MFTVPGSPDTLDSEKAIVESAKKIGFPVMLKAAAGGGGKGMRLVRDESEIQAAFELSASHQTAKPFPKDSRSLCRA